MNTYTYDLYSKRKKHLEYGNQPEIYQYENLPLEFRWQILYIWDSVASPEKCAQYSNLWKKIHGLLLRNWGESSLPLGGFYPEEELDHFRQCKHFLLNGTSIDKVLDLIELVFIFIDRDVRGFILDKQLDIEEMDMQHPDDAINELNHRFHQHVIGYQYEKGQIIRVDSSFIHTEVVLPALRLLSSQGFVGAEEEFLSAHRFYRQQEYKNAIVYALKAFESTMKSVCDKCGWTYQTTDCAKDLIGIVFQKQILPEYLRTQFSTLRSILQSGIPAIRNKTSGHGQGLHPTVVPEYLTAYALHLTASNIVFLMDAYMAHEGTVIS
jgi:AbiJ N-terminal domain 4